MKQKNTRPGPNYQSSIELFRISEILWEASRVFLARWDLSPSQFNILNLLDGRAEGCAQAELSRQLIMHRSNVTGLVDRLAARGLVERQDTPGDRRAFNIALTGAGEKLMRQIQPVYYESLEKIWGGSDENRARALVSSLQTIAAKASEVAHANPPAPSPAVTQAGGSYANKNNRHSRLRRAGGDASDQTGN